MNFGRISTKEEQDGRWAGRLARASILPSRRSERWCRAHNFFLLVGAWVPRLTNKSTCHSQKLSWDSRSTIPTVSATIQLNLPAWRLAILLTHQSHGFNRTNHSSRHHLRDISTSFVPTSDGSSFPTTSLLTLETLSASRICLNYFWNATLQNPYDTISHIFEILVEESTRWRRVFFGMRYRRCVEWRVAFTKCRHLLGKLVELADLGAFQWRLCEHTVSDASQAECANLALELQWVVIDVSISLGHTF